jgi:hypothetical protein
VDLLGTLAFFLVWIAFVGYRNLGAAEHIILTVIFHSLLPRTVELVELALA